MKLTRAQFLKALPAAALVLAGCTAAPTVPADTDELVFDHAYPLDYATQFSADCYADGSTLLSSASRWRNKSMAEVDTR